MVHQMTEVYMNGNITSIVPDHCATFLPLQPSSPWQQTQLIDLLTSVLSAVYPKVKIFSLCLNVYIFSFSLLVKLVYHCCLNCLSSLLPALINHLVSQQLKVAVVWSINLKRMTSSTY